MKKLSVTNYLKQHYPNGQLNRQTIINRLKNRTLEGEQDGTKWFIFVDKNGFALKKHTKENTTASEVAAAILKRNRG